MHSQQNVKINYDVITFHFFQSGLGDTKILFPVFNIISGKMLGGKAVYMLANRCAILGKYTYTCVSIARGRNDNKVANSKRSLITCTYKNTREELPKTNAAILYNKTSKANRSIGCFCAKCIYFVMCWIYDQTKVKKNMCFLILR